MEMTETLMEQIRVRDRQIEQLQKGLHQAHAQIIQLKKMIKEHTSGKIVSGLTMPEEGKLLNNRHGRIHRALREKWDAAQFFEYPNY